MQTNILKLLLLCSCFICLTCHKATAQQTNQGLQQADTDTILKLVQSIDENLTGHWKKYKLHKQKPEVRIDTPTPWGNIDRMGELVKDTIALKRCAVYGKDAQLYIFPEFAKKLKLVKDTSASSSIAWQTEPYKVLIRALGDAHARRNLQYFGIFYRSDYGGLNTLTYGHQNRANPSVILGFITEYEYMKTFCGEKRELKDYLQQYADAEGYKEMMTECLQNYPLDTPNMMPMAIMYEHLWLMNVMLHDMLERIPSDKKNQIEQQMKMAQNIITKAENDVPHAFCKYIKNKYPLGSIRKEIEQAQQKKKQQQPQQIVQQPAANPVAEQLSAANMKIFKLNLRKNMGVLPTKEQIQQNLKHAADLAQICSKLDAYPNVWEPNGHHTPEIINLKRDFYILAQQALIKEALDPMELFILINSKINSPAMAEQYTPTLQMLMLDILLSNTRLFNFHTMYKCKDKAFARKHMILISEYPQYKSIVNMADAYMKKRNPLAPDPCPNYTKMMRDITRKNGILNTCEYFEIKACTDYARNGIYIVD